MSMFISDDPHRTDNHSRARDHHHSRRRLLPRWLTAGSSPPTWPRRPRRDLARPRTIPSRVVEVDAVALVNGSVARPVALRVVEIHAPRLFIHDGGAGAVALGVKEIDARLGGALGGARGGGEESDAEQYPVDAAALVDGAHCFPLLLSVGVVAGVDGGDHRPSSGKLSILMSTRRTGWRNAPSGSWAAAQYISRSAVTACRSWTCSDVMSAVASWMAISALASVTALFHSSMVSTPLRTSARWSACSLSFRVS